MINQKTQEEILEKAKELLSDGKVEDALMMTYFIEGPRDDLSMYRQFNLLMKEAHDMTLSETDFLGYKNTLVSQGMIGEKGDKSGFN